MDLKKTWGVAPGNNIKNVARLRLIVSKSWKTPKVNLIANRPALEDEVTEAVGAA